MSAAAFRCVRITASRSAPGARVSTKSHPPPSARSASSAVAVNTAPSAIGAGSEMPAVTAWPTIRYLVGALPAVIRTVSPTSRPIAASVSAPSATSCRPRGARPSTIAGCTEPRNWRKPHAVTERPSTSTPALHTAATAASLRSAVRRVCMRPAVTAGWRVRAHVIADQIPGPAVLRRRRHEMVEAAREHQDRDDDEDAEAGAEQRRPHRQRVPLVAAVEREANADGHRRRRTPFGRHPRRNARAGDLCAGARRSGGAQPRDRGNHQHHAHDRGEPDRDCAGVEPEPGVGFGLGRDADGEDRRREHRADDREDPADQRNRNADGACRKGTTAWPQPERAEGQLVVVAEGDLA